MLNAIKNKFINFSLSKSEKNSVSRSKLTKWEKSNNIGVIINAKALQNCNTINTFVASLNQKGKKVSLLCFDDTDSNTLNTEQNSWEVYSLKDYSLFGKLNKEEAIKFENNNFDYLICLCTDDIPAIWNTVKNSKANNKLGLFSENRKNLLDLMVYAEKTISTEDLYKQLIQLIETIAI